MSGEGNNVVFVEDDGQRKIEGELLRTRKKGNERIVEVRSKKIEKTNGQLRSTGKSVGLRAKLVTELRTYEVPSYKKEDIDKLEKEDIDKLLELDKLLEECLVDDDTAQPPASEVTDTSQSEKTKESRLTFALKDYDVVHTEIMDIKSCRTNIFVGTLGFVGAVGIAILGIVGASDAASWLEWLPWAALIPVGLLTSAILATVHKARGISVRAGYMEALSEYLAKGDVPKCFCGWTKAKLVLDRCGVHPGKKETLDDRSVCPENKEEASCPIVAKKLARELVKDIRWRPDLLHSFTSLSTHIYTVAYVVAVGSLLFAVMSTIKSHMSGFSRKIYIIVCGAVITAVFSIIIKAGRQVGIRGRKDSELQGEASAEENFPETMSEKLLRWVFLQNFGYFAGGVVTTLFLGLLYAQTKDVAASWVAVVAYCLGGGISALAISIGYSFYDKVKSLRKGRHSIERWRHIWKICFERCPLIAGDTLTVLANEPKSES